MERAMKVEDYIFCITCNMYVDLWKYDSIEDSGHGECVYRFVDNKELPKLIESCEENGCFKHEKL